MTEFEPMDLLACEERAKRGDYRNDIRFMAGLETLRRAEAARLSGHIESYSVLYCSGDPAVVHTVFINGKIPV